MTTIHRPPRKAFGPPAQVGGMRPLALLALLLLPLAGCTSGGHDDAPAAPAADREAVGCCPCTGAAVEDGWCRPENATLPQEAPATLELAGCLQLHTSFPFPVAMFAQVGFTMPTGFAFDSADGQTVNVLLAWWFCPGGRLNNTPNNAFADVGSMFAAMPVVPPADLAGKDPGTSDVQLDLLPLTWVVSSQLPADFLGQIEGLRDGYVEKGAVSLDAQNAVGSMASYTSSAVASFGVFTVDPTVQVAPSPNPEGRYRMWLSPDSVEATGWLDIDNGAGTTVGQGYTDLRFNGDPSAGAPPATVGTAHVVQDVAVRIAYNALGATT